MRAGCASIQVPTSATWAMNASSLGCSGPRGRRRPSRRDPAGRSRRSARGWPRPSRGPRAERRCEDAGPRELLRGVLGVPLHRDDDRPVDGKPDPTRSRVWRSSVRPPKIGTYCFGRSSPRAERTRGRRRTPSPPASTTAQKSIRGLPGVGVRCVAKVTSCRGSTSSCSWPLSDLACGGHGTCRPRRRGTQLGCQAPAVAMSAPRPRIFAVRSRSLPGARNFFPRRSFPDVGC
jgi:hypothetical protein